MTSTLLFAAILAASPAVPSAPQPDQARAAAAQAEVDKKFIDISDQPALACSDVGDGATTCTTTIIDVPTQGKTFRRVLDPKEFYELVGRDDLATQYDANLTRRHAVAGVGTVAALGLLVAAVVVGTSSSAAAPCDPSLPMAQFQACANQAQSSGESTALTIGALGLGAAMIGGGAWMYALSDANPVPLAVQRGLAQEYDRNLELGAGLPPTSEREPAEHVPAVQWAVAPQVSSQGGRLELALRF